MSLDWGLGHYETTAAQLAPAAEVAVATANCKPGENVLDLGCGTGNATVLAAQTGAHVVGVDPAARLLEVARGRATSAGLSITFEPGDAANIPLADGSVDALISVFAVIFAPDAREAAAEMARVVAPTGRIVLAAWQPTGPLAEMNRTIGAVMSEAFGAPPAAPPDPDAIQWHDASSLERFFGPYGFGVHVDEHRISFRAPSVEAYVDGEHQNHPMSVSANAALAEIGKADEVNAEVRARLIELLTATNEDPTAFCVTSGYVVATLTRPAN